MPRPASDPVPFSAWLAFGLVSLFFLFEFVARVEPSLDSAGIMQRFSISEGQFAVLASLFFWVYAPMQLVVGLTLDRFGARRMIVPALLICVLGPLLFSASSNLYLAGLGRLLTGLGGAFGFVGALYVANHRFPARLFASLSGLLGAVGMIGTAIGVVWLTRATESLGWEKVFQLTGLAGLGLFVLVFLFLREGRGGGAAPRQNPLKALPQLLGQRRLWLIALVSALYYVPVNVYAGLWGKSELMADRGLAATRAEFSVSLIFWGLALGSILAGAVSDRLGHRKWLVVGGAIVSTGLFAVALLVGPGGYVSLSALLFLAGLFGGPQMLTFPMAKEGLPNIVAGTALSLVNMVAIGGAMIFQPVAGYLLEASNNDYRTALIPVFAAPLAAAFLCLFIDEKRHPDHALGDKKPR